MLIYDRTNQTIIKTDNDKVKDTCVVLPGNNKCILYEPVDRDERAKVGILLMHEADYGFFAMARGLAERGFITLGGSAGQRTSLEKQMLAVRDAVLFLKTFPGIERVVLMGHSGGATIMTAYQRAAENGQASMKENMLYACTLKDDEVLPKADGLMLIDANYGNGAMTLLSIDPAVSEEGNGMDLDHRFDIYAADNGYREEDTVYSEEFRRMYYKAQAERNNRIIDEAVKELARIENGKGRYRDDMPYPVTGAAQIAPCNKLIPQDISLLAHSRHPYPLIHRDGTVTEEIIYCHRRPQTRKTTSGSYFTIRNLSLREFLSGAAVRANEDYHVGADGVYGIDWDHTFNCGPGNIPYIHCPSLFMGMSGGYEYLAAEYLYERSAAADKEIAFTEGATHNIYPVSAEFGDTESLTFDHQADWLIRYFVK